MNKLMDWVEEYKRLEDDQLQDKAKAKAFIGEKRRIRQIRGGISSLRLRSKGRKWLAYCIKSLFIELWKR